MLTVDICLNSAKHLPPSPTLLPELLRLLGQPNVDSSRVIQLITFDPALTAKVLQLANSSAQASATPISDLEEAILRLGFEQVYGLVAAISIGRLMKPKRQLPNAGQHELWRHSVACAVAAQLLARDVGEDTRVVFTAALLHDIGKIVLFDLLDAEYASLIQEVETNQHSLIEAEKRALGVDHAEVGGRLLARWQFPLNLSAPVIFHHCPAAALSHDRLAALIYLGNLISYLIGCGFGNQALAIKGRAEALKILKLNGEQLPAYMAATYAQSAAIQMLLNARG
jgi:putative nucleotidyltransferase with HDIG domain